MENQDLLQYWKVGEEHEWWDLIFEVFSNISGILRSTK